MTLHKKDKSLIFYKRLQVFLAFAIPILVLGTTVIQDPMIEMISLFSIIILLFPLAVFVFIKVNRDSSKKNTNMAFQFLAVAIFLGIFAYGIFFM